MSFKLKLKFKSFKSAPKSGKSFLAILPGFSVDICWYDKETGKFRDYYHKQKISYIVAWAKLPKSRDMTKMYNKYGVGVNTGAILEEMEKTK